MTINRQQKIIGNEPLKKYVWLLLLVLLFGLFTYGYLVRGAIINIVDRQNMENNLSGLNSRILSLESEYLKLKNAVTPELAFDLGFVQATAKKFVAKDTKNPNLSLVTSGF